MKVTKFRNNLLSDGTSTNTYDKANRLTSVTQGGVAYNFVNNGLGDRLQQTVDTVTTNYTLDINTRLTQVLSDGTDTYLYGLERIGEYDSANWTYPLADALGSVRQLTDVSGTPVMAQNYAPYGDVLESYGAESSNYGFAGEWTDGTGLQYLRARYLNTGIGRFIQQDPFYYISTLPATINPYQYAFNNPLLYIDPSGENPFLIAAALGALIGGAFNYGAQVYGNYESGAENPWLDCISLGDIGKSALVGGVAGVIGLAAYVSGALFMGASVSTTTLAVSGLGWGGTFVAGAIGGVIGGQAARVTAMTLEGDFAGMEQGLLDPGDMVLDAALGGTFAVGAKAVGPVVKSIKKWWTNRSQTTALVPYDPEYAALQMRLMGMGKTGTPNAGSSVAAADFIVYEDGTIIPTDLEVLEAGFKKAGLPSYPNAQTTEPGTIYELPSGNKARVMYGSNVNPPRLVVHAPGGNPILPNEAPLGHLKGPILEELKHFYLRVRDG